MKEAVERARQDGADCDGEAVEGHAASVLLQEAEGAPLAWTLSELYRRVWFMLGSELWAGSRMSAGMRPLVRRPVWARSVL